MKKYSYGKLSTSALNSVRAWFPNKSLPAVITEDVLESLGIKTTEEKEDVYVPSLDEMKADRARAIRAESNALLSEMREGYSDGEIETFAQQYSGARYITGSGGTMEDSLFVMSLLSGRLGRVPQAKEVDGFAKLIIANYENARDAVIKIVGNQQRLELLVREAKDEDV